MGVAKAKGPVRNYLFPDRPFLFYSDDIDIWQSIYSACKGRTVYSENFYFAGEKEYFF